MKSKITALLALAFPLFYSLCSNSCSAQTPDDTIKVMVYNTLGFGPGYCQGSTQDSMLMLYADLKTIFQFANPDIIGLDKLQCVQTGPNTNGISSYTFPDTIISECFDTNFSFCPFTDVSGCSDNCSSLIFYNHTKLGYVSTIPLYTGQEDIDLFKLYYKDPYLHTTNDTTFLYAILCHTISGTPSTPRDQQDSMIINKLKTMFPQAAPNVIYMGDFNTRTSAEPGYEYITQTDNNPAFLFADPPFHPDGHLSYPNNWNSGSSAQAYFTTTTRSTTIPNSCGTTGGAKDWYDHIFLSPWIINNTDYISYIGNSYTTIGNDGKRLGISINSGTNTSAPANVLNAEFNFSDKYPVMVSLLATNHPLGVDNIIDIPGSIKANNPVVNDNLVIHFASFLNSQKVAMGIYDICGRLIAQYTYNVTNSSISQNISLAPGLYMLHFTSGGYTTTLKVVKE